MPDAITAECNQRMDVAIEHFQREIGGIRTGRANVHLLDSVKVDYYGTPTPISQIGSVNTPDATTISIQPWDLSQIAAIEKALMASDIGITPANDGKVIRLSLPPMTGERRKELAKLVKKMGEEAKVAVRNVRRDEIEKVKKQVKDKAISEDDGRKVEADIQKITDRHTDRIDTMIAAKDKEIMDT